MTTPSSDNLVLGRGVIRGQQILGGVLQPMRHLGNVPVLSVTTAISTKDVLSSMVPGTVVYKQFQTGKTVTLDIEGDEEDINNLAMQLMGDVVDIGAQVSGSVASGSPEVHPYIAEGMLQLAFQNASAIVVKQATTSLVAGDDYTVVDAMRGLIQINADGSTIVPATDFSISYTYGARAAGKMIRGGTQSKMDYKLYFFANNADGPNRDFVFFHVAFQPNGAYGLISQTDERTWKLTGTLLDDSAGQYGGSVANNLYYAVDAPVAP